MTASVPTEMVYALPARYYIDSDIFAAETSSIFENCWHMVAHQNQISRAGDYLTFSLGSEDLFIVRGEDERLRCFYNVCQHRAHQLLEGEGNSKLIACPYHAWTYALDGKLRKARNQENVLGFDASKICLTEVRLEQFCGFVFVNLDYGAPNMSDLFPGVAEEINQFVPNIEDLEFAHQHRAEVDANWKITVENYNECYHCRVAHPTFTQGVVTADSYRVETKGDHFQHTASAPQTSAYEFDADSTMSASEYSSWFFWPLASIQVYPGNIVNTYRWLPINPEKTVVLREWYLPNAKATDEEWKVIELDRTTTFEEDLRLMTSVQKGLHSRGYRPGPLMIDPSGNVNSEHPVYEIQKKVLKALGEA